MNVALAVIAKTPVAGRVKTRLTPPCTPEQAAGLAEAALRDTLLAVAQAPATRRVLVLDGEPGDWLPDGFEVIAQRGDGLDERLAAAFDDLAAPAFLVGMDTPQVTPELLAQAQATLLEPGVDAVLGHTDDGGYWGIGLRASHAGLFTGVPMSRDDTGARQVERLLEHAVLVDDDLPRLRDVDTIVDARAVAALAPHTRFAAAYEALPAEARGRFAPRPAPTEPAPGTSATTSVPGRAAGR